MTLAIITVIIFGAVYTIYFTRPGDSYMSAVISGMYFLVTILLGVSAGTARAKVLESTSPFNL